MFDFKAHMTAGSVDAAIDLLARHPGARLIAGGTDVLLRLRQGDDRYASLVDIHGLADLRFIDTDGDQNIRIGSGTVFSDLLHADIICRRVPVLAEAAGSVGGPQIRNVATLGGNLCNGSPGADSAPALFVLNARLEIKGKQGVRQVPIADFYQGPFRVDLGPSEILTAVIIPRQDYQGYAGHYYKYAVRKAMDIATIGCAVSLRAPSGRMEDFRIAYGAAGPVPLRCPAAEQAAAGRRVTGRLLTDIADAVLQDVAPRTSWRASGEFRRHLAAELAIRVTRTALDRAGQAGNGTDGLCTPAVPAAGRPPGRKPGPERSDP
jgi:xanthine dehydrogenase FAD-binding subunit